MINEQVSAADGSEHDTKSLDNNRLASEKKTVGALRDETKTKRNRTPV